MRLGSSLDSTGYGIPKMEYVPKISDHFEKRRKLTAPEAYCSHHHRSSLKYEMHEGNVDAQRTIEIMSLYTEKWHLDGCEKRSEDIKNLAAP
jgi:hypothetical protein